MSATVTKRVLLDIDRCVECGSCGAVCFYSHAAMPIVQTGEPVGPAMLPVICRQCKAASCLEACPVGAMQRDEQTGIIRRALFRCIGCGSCARACPFGVLPREVTRRQIAKCDLCIDRTGGDSSAVPRCVASCPSGALRFDDEHQAVSANVLVVGGRSTGEHPFKRR